MAILAGVDEAGFGPILGPLVVSSSVFSVPDEMVEANLWEVLRGSISDKRRNLAGRILVCDSKKAYSRAAGIGQLRRTILTLMKYAGREPRKLAGLLELLCPDFLEQMGDYPWYKGAQQTDLEADEGDIAVAAAVVRKDFTKQGVKLLALESKTLEVEYYNRMVAAVKNKAKVLFSATAALIQSAAQHPGEGKVQIIVDRQGGRSHYRRELQLMFEGREITILRESDRVSSYELTDGSSQMRVHFVVGADSRFLPVSLASMVSKYVRELLVACINRYFRGFNSELRPTAGYWKDGLRFIEDLKTYAPQAKFDANQLIRCR